MPATDARVDVLRHRIDCVLGREVCELCLENANVFDVFSGQWVPNSRIFIDGDLIIDAGTQTQARAQYTVDLKGKRVVPGFIDAHVHIESSMATPVHYARLVAPLGTTTVVADPHEIANVSGPAGIDYMLQASAQAEISIYTMLSSCVPATGFETSGAQLSAEDLARWMDDDRVLGLGEVMNVPGVLARDPQLLEKIALAQSKGKYIDGHSPLLSGAGLSAYAAAGVRSEHEASMVQEVIERVPRGITIFMREGSVASNVTTLSRAVTRLNAGSFAFCTDDRAPEDILTRGHINYAMARARRAGVPAEEVLRMATIQAARHYGLRQKGAIAPGRDADIVVLKDIEDFRVHSVYAKGRRIAQNGRMITPEPYTEVPCEMLSRVNMQPVSPEALKVTTQSGKVRVIGLMPGEILTDHRIESVRTHNNEVRCCDNPGLLKAAVVERHHATGNVAVGLVRGMIHDNAHFGGALCSSISHDSHNLVCIGDDDNDMLFALQTVRAMGGGIALVRRGRVVHKLALEVAGLMSDAPAQQTARTKGEIMATLYRDFHVRLDIHPVMATSFLALPVIPHLRLTDRGLFNVDRFAHVAADPIDAP